jgi:hypothetical protein
MPVQFPITKSDRQVSGDAAKDQKSGRSGKREEKRAGAPARFLIILLSLLVNKPSNRK